jgi:hypothetical protein
MLHCSSVSLVPERREYLCFADPSSETDPESPTALCLPIPTVC